MQEESIPLEECIEACLENWIEDYREEATRGSTEAILIYSQLLLHGTSSRRPDIQQAEHWLRKACKSSPEAAFRLAKLYSRDKYLRKDLEKSYFYYRLATLFRCKCGKHKEDYHTGTMSHVHACYPYEAAQAVQNLGISSSARQRYEDNFNSWRMNNLR